MIDLPNPKTVIEPFRIKTVEPMPLPSAEERSRLIQEAGYNLFALPATAVTFDLLTDSGTSAMSSKQWAALMIGDESYAGSRSFYTFESAVKDLTGFAYVIPTHQGRSAEALLMKVLVQPGQVIVGNTHFDTTRANIEMVGAEALDMPIAAAKETALEDPFKGNIDLEKLQSYLKDNSKKVAAVILTVTSNSVGGQPVSLANIQQTKNIAEAYGIPLFLDAARFAENAYFIKRREPAYAHQSVRKIARKMFSIADGTLMSAKKDAFANIGGFLALSQSNLAEQIRSLMVLTEGFPTYGGLAGRDMDCLAVGLDEIQDEDYLAYRLRSVEYFGKGIEAAGLKVVKPFGGHAVYIDAGSSLPHIPWYQYPGQALSIALYEYIGIRSVEIGSIMLGSQDPETGEEKPAPKELVRLAMPRRVYTQSHVDYMVEMISHLAPCLDQLKGVEFSYQPKVLRHFTAKYQKIKAKARADAAAS